MNKLIVTVKKVVKYYIHLEKNVFGIKLDKTLFVFVSTRE